MGKVLNEKYTPMPDKKLWAIRYDICGQMIVILATCDKWNFLRQGGVNSMNTGLLMSAEL